MDDKVRLLRAINLFDLESYVEQNFSPVRRSGDELRVNCFAPKGCSGSDDKQHLWINHVKKRWICYKCGYGDHKQQEGTSWLPRFIADAEGVSISEVRRRLLGHVEPTPAEELGDLLEASFRSREIVAAPGGIEIPGSFGPVKAGSKAGDYAAKRGLTRELLKKYDVRYCQDIRQKRWLGRLIFPVRDLEGVIKTASGRDVTGRKPKSRAWEVWPGTDIQSLLWPLAWHEGQRVFTMRDLSPEHVVVVEGVFDALGVLLSGYDSLCTFGKKLSQRQVEVLQKIKPREVTLAWDYDARAKMVKLVKQLQGRFELVSVFPFQFKEVWSKADFGDMLEQEQLVRVFLSEMASRITVESDAYLGWAAQIGLESMCQR